MAKIPNPAPEQGQIWLDLDPRKKREFVILEVHPKNVLVQTIDGKGVDGVAPKVSIKMKRLLDAKLYRPKSADEQVSERLDETFNPLTLKVEDAPSAPIDHVEPPEHDVGPDGLLA